MRRVSPFSDPTFARASENLAQIIAGNPERRAALEASLTDARATQQKSRFQRENERQRNSAGDAAFLGDQNRLAADLIRSGAAPSGIGSVIQAIGGIGLANGEFTEDQQLAFMSGAGNAGGPDTALSTGRADGISARNAKESLAEVLSERRLINTNNLAVADRDNRGALRRTQAEINGTLEGAAVNATPADQLGDPEVVRELASALDANNLTPETVLAEAMRTGRIGTEQGVRIGDPLSTDELQAQRASVEGRSADEIARLGENLSADETLASVLGGDPDRLSDLRFDNGPNADARENAGDGAGGPEPVDPLDVTRIRETQRQLTDAASNFLVDAGAPTTKNSDGDLAFDFRSKPELVPQAVELAFDAQEADRLAGRAPAPPEVYVREAMRTLGVEVNDGVDQGLFGVFDEDPTVSIGNAIDPPPEQNSGGDGGTITIGNQTVSRSDIQDTARKWGISEQEVVRLLQQRLGVEGGTF